jgi:hypothetical protein
MIGERIGVRSQAVSVPLSLLSYFRGSLHFPVFCTASIDLILDPINWPIQLFPSD